MQIVALNAGSSSIKAALHAFDSEPAEAEPARPPWEAHASWTALPGLVAIRITKSGAEPVERTITVTDPGETFRLLLEALWSGPARAVGAPEEIGAVGHRIVHGGHFRESMALTPDVRSAIAGFKDLAPAHNQIELEGVQAVDRALGSRATQVAVFDTAFHADIPAAAHVYPGPYAWLEQGIRRYGFHGISHQYAAAHAARMLRRDPRGLRLITCHLGNGCSLTAVKDGRSIDTTMGFTPLEGLMMGSRSGSVDPGILIYLLRHGGYTVDQLDRTLNRESGLLGVSGVSSDMREVLAAMAAGNPRARLAHDIYAHRLRTHIGALAASLGGLDALVFTAGVGENSPEIRAAACSGLEFLGVAIDPAKNAVRGTEGEISAAGAAVRTLVVRAQEEWEIARECFRVATSKQGAA